jgi:hypothetical protein
MKRPQFRFTSIFGPFKNYQRKKYFRRSKPVVSLQLRAFGVIGSSALLETQSFYQYGAIFKMVFLVLWKVFRFFPPRWLVGDGFPHPQFIEKMAVFDEEEVST